MTITVTPVQQEFLITGHGRSGTHYMADLFTSLGFPVGRKWHGEYGMVHHFPFCLIPWPYTEWKERYLNLIHYVRNPWKVIESTYLHKDTFRTPGSMPLSIVEENASKIPEINSGNDLEKVIRSVVLWNRNISEANPSLTVKVEEAPSVCKKWLESNGYDSGKSSASLPPTTTNHRTANDWELDRKVPWDSIGEVAMGMLNKYCLEYGYETK